MTVFTYPVLAAALLCASAIPGQAQNTSSFTASSPDAPTRFTPVSPQVACSAVERLDVRG